MLALQKNIAIIICGDRNRHIDFITHTILSPLLNLRQHILENSIIRLHAIVQINGNHLVGKVMNLFLVGSDLSILCLQGGQLFI